MRARPTARDGSAVLVVLLLAVLFGFVALVLDLGYAWYVQSQVQGAADAAALAGVRSLNRTPRGVVNAREAAVQVAALNRAEDAPVVLAPNVGNVPGGDIVFGVWDGTSFRPAADAAQIDAVEVRARHVLDTTGLSRVAFARSTLAVSARAVAVQGIRLGASEVPFYLPFALPRCVMESWPKDRLAQMTFVLNPANADNVGWGLLGTTLSASALQAHVAATIPCMRAWYDSGYVGTACTHARITDALSLGNGEAESATRYLADRMADGIPWDPRVWGPLPPQDSKSSVARAAYGRTIAGPLPIFDGGAGYCSGNEPWNGQTVISGFVWAAIYDVRATGAASERNVWLRIDPITYRDIGEWYGGPDYGLVYVGPAVVVR